MAGKRAELEVSTPREKRVGAETRWGGRAGGGVRLPLQSKKLARGEFQVAL